MDRGSKSVDGKALVAAGAVVTLCPGVPDRKEIPTYLPACLPAYTLVRSIV